MKKSVLAWLFAFRPTAVYGLLTRRLRKALRLNHLVGVEPVSMGQGVAEARLAKSRKVLDETGAIQPSAIVVAAEAAARYAAAGAFAPIAGTVESTILNATAKFTAPAKTSLRAQAMVIGHSLDLRESVKDDGEVAFDVVVDVTDEAGAEIAQVIFSWRVALIAKAQAPEAAAPK